MNKKTCFSVIEPFLYKRCCKIDHTYAYGTFFSLHLQFFCTVFVVMGGVRALRLATAAFDQRLVSLKGDLSIIYCNINEFDINSKRLQRFCLKTYTNKTFPVITLELEKSYRMFPVL